MISDNSTRMVYLSSVDESPDLLAFGLEDDFEFSDDLFKELDDFIAKHRGSYLFSCLSYDLKNKIEKLSSKNSDKIDFPMLKIWKAQLVISLKNEEIEILEGKMTPEFEAKIQEILASKKRNTALPSLTFKSQISKETYIQKVKEIKQEISIGNVYELNFCQEFYAEKTPDFDSFSLFNKLQQLTKAPFSSYVNIENHEVFCGSPERFIQKSGSKLISQPIKGTIRRGKDEKEDENLKKILLSDPKERAENVMITDLVRNDFSRIASINSVKVDELCGLYTFGTVHQLISTISCEIKEKTSFSDILKATFPMGSMTGAPKISAMEISEKQESFKRGLYAGSIGYFKPNGDFDFNVVIRTLILNKENRTLSAAVGGAITSKSIPENEYEECLVKIQRLLNLFKHD
ncbi:MAG: anthranilate synthase component I family protein [Bacteroidota bacterium]